MLTTKTLVAVLTASTFLTAGAAFAQSPTPAKSTTAESTPSKPMTAQPMTAQPMTAQQKTAEKDFGKLSKDGSRAFQDLALTRLAIFDGRTGEAKKFVGEADTAFGKAQSDDTVFTKAEGDLKSAQGVNEQGRSATSGTDQSASASNENNAGTQSAANASESGSNAEDMKKPIKWLPVDGEITINDNFTANPTKAAAVADANKSLAKGDRKGALDKLKLADVDLDIVLAVVPVNQTVKDVHQASQMVNDGKFYEASQLLRKVQDSARFDVADVVGVPKGSQSSAVSSDAASSKSASSKSTSSDTGSSTASH